MDVASHTVRAVLQLVLATGWRNMGSGTRASITSVIVAPIENSTAGITDWIHLLGVPKFALHQYQTLLSC